MNVDVKWETDPVPGISFARTGKLKVGSRAAIEMPFRATYATKTTSESEAVYGASNSKMPMKTLATYYTPLNRASIDNITKTNGKFAARKTEANYALSRVDEEAIRVVYGRIPKGEEDSAPTSEQTVKSLNEDESAAIFDFLNGITKNDILLIPVPSRIEKADDMDPIIKGWEDRVSSIGTKKPLMAYIPSVEDPLLARSILEKYLSSKLDFRMFALDFSNGHAPRTTTEVVTTLMKKHKKKEIDDFYLHGMNTRHFYDQKNSSVAVEDLFSHIIGMDSFNNVLWPRGGGTYIKVGTPQEKVFIENKKLRYWYEDDYGGHRYDEAIPRAKKSGCQCPVCANNDIESVYRDYDNDKAYGLLRAHHVFSELVGEKRQAERIVSGTLDKYLYAKELPERRGLVSYTKQLIRSAGA